ncbi:MAG: hypothetical protein PHP23_00545 [Desulfobacterales bacterium]|nr:hypothetical protein [Desulfobacterales bacterium]MDD4071040.1 hypothetical protein [Desulfobacterales bacterium]MDD4392437.1 hypothetical protein [Desulfobacterales bacterium]
MTTLYNTLKKVNELDFQSDHSGLIIDYQAPKKADDEWIDARGLRQAGIKGVSDDIKTPGAGGRNLD